MIVTLVGIGKGFYMGIKEKVRHGVPCQAWYDQMINVKTAGLRRFYKNSCEGTMMRRRQIAVILVLVVCSFMATVELRGEKAAMNERRTRTWADYKKANNLIKGRIIPASKDNPEQLELSGPGYIPFLYFKNNEIKRPVIFFVGQIRCEGVKGTGVVEMKAKDQSGREYIQASQGGGTKFQGDMGWKLFYVPFAMPLKMETGPEELQISVCLPGAGKVFFSSPFTEFRTDRKDASWMVKPKVKRLSDLNAYGWYLAGFFGICLFAVLLVKKGKAKVVLYLFLGITFVVGAVLFVSGMTGFIRTHDWWVGGPIWVLGSMQMVVPVVLFFVSRKYYR
jgi:hypothetical protein